MLVPASDVILTLTGKELFTLNVIALEVAGLFVTQAQEDVKIQVTTSLSFNELVEKTELFVPALTPLICH